MDVADRKARILLYGFGMICAPCGNTPISSRRSVSGWSGSTRVPCSAAIARMRCRISSRASGCSASGTPNRRRALAGVVVGRRADPAAREHHVACREKAWRRSAVMRCGSSPT